MNVFKKRQTRHRPRHGVTIVEVLTSIVVAVIGVAGVLVLIPFGIRQAEVGLDLDDSISMAENALARFEIEGYRRVLTDDFGPFLNGDMPWIHVSPSPLQNTLVNVIDIQANPNNYSFFIIDPLWTNSQPANPTLNTPGFPHDPFFNDVFLNQPTFVANYPAAVPLLPQIVTLLNSDQNNQFAGGVFQPLPQALAARMFLTSEDMQFATDTNPLNGLDLDDLAPPQPYLDVDPNRLSDGNDNDGDGDIDEPDEQFTKRQSRGEISWSAIAVPSQIGGAFEFYMLIYDKRSFADPTDSFVGNEELDPRFPVSLVTNTGDFRSGGAVQVVDQVNIANDDWVLMGNRHRITGNYQLGVYRVIGSNPDPNVRTISLDGPGFLFDDQDNDPNTNPTIIIHLKNAVNVYRRTLLPEGDSVYTLSN